MKTFFTTVVSLIIGIIIGIVATVFFYPFVFPPAQVNEQIQNIANKQVVASGQFIHPNPNDKLHWGKGDVTIYQQNNQYEVFLHTNFQVGPGPAFHVYLSSGSNIKTNQEFKNAQNYDLGVLKSFRGSQIYNVPPSVDMSSIKSVVVWCKSFGQLITSAQLKVANTQ